MICFFTEIGIYTHNQFLQAGTRAADMADVDPETLLEWLQIGQGDERDMQLIALEQLCMLLLMSDNVDRCFERCELHALPFLTFSVA